MQPLNYSIETADPFRSVLQGYQAGAAIRDDQAQQQALLAQQQAQQRMRGDLADLLANPNAGAREYAAMTVKYPALSEQFKQSLGMLNEQQRTSSIQHASQVYAALHAGKTDVAERMMREQAEALRNSGADEQEAGSYEMWADMIREAPTQARALGGLLLASNMGPDKFSSTFAQVIQEGRAEELQPAAMEEAKAKASSATTAAKFAESKAVMDLRMSEEQIKKWAADAEIARQNSRIALMNASLAREGNDLKRQELALKVQDALRERDDKLRGKVAEVESARASIDNTINTVDKLLKNPSWRDVVGSFEGRMPEAASMLDDEESDAIAAINTLGSQVFLTKVKEAGSMSGLTEAEGKKLQDSMASLGRAQSEAAFQANLKEVQRLSLKARKNLANKYGVPESVPDTPAAQPSPAEVDDLVRKYTAGR